MFQGDPSCHLNREIVQAAQRLSYDEAVEDFILNGAARVYLKEYDPTAIKAPSKVYYAPHAIGKPEDFTVEFQDPDELFQGWFNENPVEDPIA
jgi:hypothetical protein